MKKDCLISKQNSHELNYTSGAIYSGVPQKFDGKNSSRYILPTHIPKSTKRICPCFMNRIVIKKFFFASKQNSHH